MAFLTGVGLETHLGEDDADEEALELVPRKMLALPAHRSDFDQLDILLDREEPPSFNQLIKNAQVTRMDDPLEELRRRIKRTRQKMDAQNKVLDGFINEVQDMQCSSPFSSPRAGRAALPAPAPKSFAALGAPAVPALPGPAPRQRSSVRPGAIENCPRSTRSTRPSSANTSAGASSRGAPVRSSGQAGTLGQSHSQPSLQRSSVVGGLHQRDTAAIVMPQRRAPPGAPGCKMQKSYAASSLRKQAVSDTYSFNESSLSAASRRYSSLGRSRLSG
mmetsp:Transcript_139681/g.260494  ORF Transcript_139681/g.260494 Transcript_139681/m.260494 type:complete len:275 (+) Transcript_139681:102-926(+)